MIIGEKLQHPSVPLDGKALEALLADAIALLDEATIDQGAGQRSFAAWLKVAGLTPPVP